MNTIGYIIVFVVIIGIFLLIREFWCWYYKSNAILEKLNKLESDIEFIKNNINNK